MCTCTHLTSPTTAGSWLCLYAGSTVWVTVLLRYQGEGFQREWGARAGEGGGGGGGGVYILKHVISH